MKKNLGTLLLIAFVVSVINIFAIINSSNDTSIQAISGRNNCTAQGDFKPAPFKEIIVEESSTQKIESIICSAQGDVRPPAWDEKDDKVIITASAQGDVRPPAWDEKEDKSSSLS